MKIIIEIPDRDAYREIKTSHTSFHGEERAAYRELVADCEDFLYRHRIQGEVGIIFAESKDAKQV